MKKLIKPIMKDRSKEITERVLEACEAHRAEFKARQKVISTAEQFRYIDTIEEWRKLDNQLSSLGGTMVNRQSNKEAILSDLTERELEIYRMLIH